MAPGINTDDGNEGDDNTPREHHVSNSGRIDLLGRLKELEDNDEQQRLDIASLLASRRTWRWALGLGLPVLLTSLVVVALWSIDRISVSSERAGRTEAEIKATDTLNKARSEALENLIRLLQQDVSQLRQRAGLEPSSAMPALRDRVTTTTAKDPHVLVSLP